jgi:transcription antitermination factor NusG
MCVGDGAKLYPHSGEGEINMTAAASFQSMNPEGLYLPPAYSQQRWYAAYTCANHEKCVAAELETRAVEHLLPLYSAVRRWRDRRVRLDLPLFPGYVFLRLALRDKLRVLQIPSVVRLVGFNGQPAALSDDEIEVLRRGLTARLQAEPHPYLSAGRRARVISGPLQGLEGIIVHRKNRSRLVISLHLIMRSVSVELDDANLMPVN